MTERLFLVPNGSNKMQEASRQMSLSSAITGESGNGICLHSRNSRVHREGEAEMAREAESNLGLWNELRKDSSVPTWSRGLAHHPFTGHADSSLSSPGERRKNRKQEGNSPIQGLTRSAEDGQCTRGRELQGEHWE